MEIINAWDFKFDTSADADWQKFLKTLRKNGNSRIRGFFHKKNPRKKNDYGAKASLEEAINAATIEDWQQRGYGVYVVIGNGGDEDAEITDIPACFIEWDDMPLEEQLNFDWSNFLEPTMQVGTINSGHTYWVFDENITDKQEWRNLQERLIAIFKSDKSIKNPSRLMRLPSCYYADAEGKLTKKIGIERYSGKTYKLEDFIAAIEREEKRLDIKPATKSKATQQGRKGWITEATRQRLKKENARPVEHIVSALKLWPPRVPDSGTYRGTNPVTNHKGREVHIDYYTTAVGCMKAFLYADVEFEDALALMQEQHPEWVELRQNLEASGGCGHNGRPIEDNTFWAVAMTKLDWEPSIDDIAEDDFTCDMQDAAVTLQQNRATAAEELDLMTVFPKNLAMPLAERADTFPVHQSALFAPVCAAFASIAGKRLRVQVKRGHVEPLVFWFANVQQVSEMKSPVGREGAYEPLVRFAAVDGKRYSVEREQVEREFAAAHFSKKSLIDIRKLRDEDSKA